MVAVVVHSRGQLVDLQAHLAAEVPDHSHAEHLQEGGVREQVSLCTLNPLE